MDSTDSDGKFRETKSNPVTLDDIFIKFSLWGRYHLKLLFYLGVAFAANSMYSYSYIFAVEKIEYRCKHSISLCSISLSNGSIVDDFNPQCYQRVTQDEEISCAYANNSEVVPCTEWVYDKPDSFVAEFLVACQDWKNALVGTAHCVGWMIGLPFVGSLSDRLGRKKVFIATAVAGGVIGVVKSFSCNYWMYIFFELCEALIGDLCSACFMLMAEMVATVNRPMFLMTTHFGYTIGHFLAAAAAWYLPYWRLFVQVIYAPSILFVLYIFLIDESPRWLLTKGRKQEAVEILKKMARTNKITLDKAELDNLKCEDKTENIGYGVLLKSTFQSKIILKRFLVCMIWWIAGTFLNFGAAINAVLLSGNKYVNYVLIYVLDIPEKIVMGYVLTYTTRKMPLMLSFFAAAIFFGIHPFITDGYPWLSLVFYIGGKGMSMIFFNITYIFTSELFPTSTRNSMHALCSAIGRIGSVVAQQTPLLRVYWHGLPSILMAGMALLASLVTLLVPDTGDDDLPDNVREAENIGMRGVDKVKTRL